MTKIEENEGNEGRSLLTDWRKHILKEQRQVTAMDERENHCWRQ